MNRITFSPGPAGRKPFNPVTAKIKVEKGRYGLTGGQARDCSYNIKINGENHIISDDAFLKLTASNRTVYLATDHNAACYFSILERQNGSIKGDEEWLHVDKREHPDNAFLCGGEALSPSSGLDVIREYLNKRGGISVANFMTAQAKIFPDMSYLFLHDGRGTHRNADDWHGMKYSRACPLGEWRSILSHERPKILSLDLDIFGFYRDSLRGETVEMIKDNVFGIAGKSKIVMIFTSPDYINKNYAEKWMEEIVRELISAKTD